MEAVLIRTLPITTAVLGAVIGTALNVAGVTAFTIFAVALILSLTVGWLIHQIR